jgi:hypothetical protein
MRTNRPAMCAERWIIPDTFSVDALIDAVLYEQAWWIAVQCGKHAHKGVVWAEGTRRTNRHGQTASSGSFAIPSTAEEG